MLHSLTLICHSSSRIHLLKNTHTCLIEDGHLQSELQIKIAINMLHRGQWLFTESICIVATWDTDALWAAITTSSVRVPSHKMMQRWSMQRMLSSIGMPAIPIRIQVYGRNVWLSGTITARKIIDIFSQWKHWPHYTLMYTSCMLLNTLELEWLDCCCNFMRLTFKLCEEASWNACYSKQLFKCLSTGVWATSSKPWPLF